MRETGRGGSDLTAGDEKELVLTRLLLAHEAWFDIERDHEFAGRRFPGYAEFHTHGEQYVLVKRAKMWEVDSHEYLFFETIDHLTEKHMDEDIEFMKTRAIEKVDPKPNHMSSCISLVVIADAVDEGVAKTVRHTRFRKNFWLGIRGWADLRLAVIDLSSKSVVTNGAGKELKPTLEANIGRKTDPPMQGGAI